MEGSLAALRHEARGYMNAARLCATAMGLSGSAEEDRTFIDAIITACDDLCRVMEQMEPYLDDPSQESTRT